MNLIFKDKCPRCSSPMTKHDRIGDTLHDYTCPQGCYNLIYFIDLVGVDLYLDKYEIQYDVWN